MPAWLSPAGTFSAIIVGAAIWYGAGWRGLVLLFAFFITSSALTAGGGRRRPVQVFANGGVAALCALLIRQDAAFAAAFAGALAAATADTWSTEIGGRSTIAPRLITTFARVERGANGGVTMLGTLGGVAGAALIGVTGLVTGMLDGQSAGWVAVGGVTGTLVDSVLGASLQDRWRWLNNDAVNALATTGGALVPFLPMVLG